MLYEFYNIREYMLPTITHVKVGKIYMYVCLNEHKTSLQGHVRNWMSLGSELGGRRQERERDVFLNTWLQKGCHPGCQPMALHPVDPRDIHSSNKVTPAEGRFPQPNHQPKSQGMNLIGMHVSMSEMGHSTHWLSWNGVESAPPNLIELEKGKLHTHGKPRSWSPGREKGCQQGKGGMKRNPMHSSLETWPSPLPYWRRLRASWNPRQSNQGAGPHLQRNILHLGAPPSLILKGEQLH